MTNSIIFRIHNSDLASRQAAAELRAKVESQVKAGKNVAIDFSNVFSVSESFADELFGVLVLRQGLSWLSENVSILHADPLVFRAILSSIRQRLISDTLDKPDIALLTARKVLQERRSRH